MLNWANQFNIFCLLDSNANVYTHDQKIICAVDVLEQFTATSNGLDVLHRLHNYNDWLFGNINFDLQSETENISDQKQLYVPFPIVHFFCPKILIFIHDNKVTIESNTNNCQTIFETILNTVETNVVANSTQMYAKVSKDVYINDITAIQQHIQQGDCYEINYCMEFYNQNAHINIIDTFEKLKHQSPTPFQCLYKYQDQYLICASPERYIKKTATTLISQPIKGTIKRNLENKEIDQQLIVQLKNDAKEVSENVMVVDLVRNDLSKIAKRKSVLVPELLKVYSFPQVHHLISTISAEIENSTSFVEIIKASFPMGSMTGAPKKRVLQLINSYEKTRRGLFSGSIGYIKPNGDFDFNVVIRSILYNSESKYLQYLVGSGITIYSNAENEYDECLLKAKAIEKVLGN
jgi:para-aminobenzoate synthetase component I